MKKIFTYHVAILLSAFQLSYAGYDFPMKQEECLTLGKALSETLLTSPDLSAFSYEMRAREAKVLQASLRPNPIFDFQSENLWGNSKEANGLDQAETTFLFAQVLELGGKRRARVIQATKERDLVYFDYEIKKWDLLTEVYQKFYQLLVIKKKIEIKSEGIRLLEGYIPIVQNRVERGKASVLEEMRFQVAITQAKLDLESEQRNYYKTYQSMIALWGETTDCCPCVEGNLEALPNVGNWCQLIENVMYNPQLIRLYAEAEQRDSVFYAERKKAIPDLMLKAGPRYLNEEKTWVWVLGFVVPIPVFDQNQGRIAEARALAEKVDVEIRGLFARITAKLKEAHENILDATNRINVLRDRVFPDIAKAFDAAKEGFEMGRYSYLDVIDIYNTHTRLYEEYFESLGNYHKFYAEINGLIGQTFLIESECNE